jgi:dihydropteroate synthase
MTEQITAIQMKRTIVCGGEIIDLSAPKVMGILNLTPDSFYDGGKLKDEKSLLFQAEKHLSEGATFLDLGAVSTRPNADEVALEEELSRIVPAVEVLSKNFPKAKLSIDTFRAKVAEETVHAGAHMINDISGGTMDETMFETIAKLNVPYVMMHIKGTPQTMQSFAQYENVTQEVFQFLLERSQTLKQLGVHDVILDPGFGFAKDLTQNYELMREMDQLQKIGLPILVGISRKSMINKVLNTKAAEALNGTTALNTIALQKGASILRVHDVKEAIECVKISQAMHHGLQ